MNVTTPNLDGIGPDTPLASVPTASSQLEHALGEWANLLGKEHVRYDASLLDEYAATTLPSGTRSLAVVRPANTAQVSELVKIAARYRIPVYPISRGKNWGYGDACPATDGQVIVDLGRMNRIREVNRELAYAVIEPGVTQGQLATHLKETNSGLMLDVTGAGPDASIVGNTLERGFGHTPYGDHLAHSCGMEVVLADGSVLNTGFGAFENAQAARVFPWGLGPWLDGLFTQSNLGIVTQMCIHLMPTPEHVEAFAMRIGSDLQLGEVVERLRDLRLSETVRSTVHIANDLRVLSSRERFRATIAQAPSPLPESLRSSLRKQAGLGSWNVFGGLYGTRDLRAGLRTAVRKAFGDIAKVHFFDRRKLHRLAGVARILGRLRLGQSLGEVAHNARAAFDLLEGAPTTQHLQGVFWRTSPEAVNHAGDNIRSQGLIWISPVLPMTSTACREATNLIEEVLFEHEFDALMTLSAVTPRALCCVTSIHYDKESLEDTGRATSCYEVLLNRLMNKGFLPYRSAAPTTAKLIKHSRAWETIEHLKRALDVNQILAPQRYGP